VELQSNVYSRQWFDFFHVGIDQSRTNREVAFVCRCAPFPEFRNVADICCGMGRHARALAACEYSVLGIDRDSNAIAKARELRGGPTYIQGDIRHYSPDAGAFDVAIVMAQSFGHFDWATNLNVLRRLAGSVRAKGRVILDLWNQDFFAANQGERTFEMPGGIVRETKRLDGDRLFVRLRYPDRSAEEFEWQLFTPDEMSATAQAAGLSIVLACSDFDATTPPSSATPRIQFVLERT